MLSLLAEAYLVSFQVLLIDYVIAKSSKFKPLRAILDLKSNLPDQSYGRNLAEAYLTPRHTI